MTGQISPHYPLWGSNVARHVLPSNRSVNNSRNCTVSRSMTDPRSCGLTGQVLGSMWEPQNGRLCRLGSQDRSPYFAYIPLRGIYDFHFPTLTPSHRVSPEHNVETSTIEAKEKILLERSKGSKAKRKVQAVVNSRFVVLLFSAVSLANPIWSEFSCTACDRS